MSVAVPRLQEYEGSFRFEGTWKATYVAKRYQTSARKRPNALTVDGVYSDVLYQSFLCATTPLREEWLSVDNIDRRSGLTLTDFKAEYEFPNKPVVITDVASL